MKANPDPSASPPALLHGAVADRFGVLPNFFRLGPEAPEVTANLWGFAKFGYLDNPLPSLFKERLFVYLSRFCEVRYCIARHVGFLAGLGRPAGDRAALPQTPDQIIRLIRRPLPRDGELEPQLAHLRAIAAPLAPWPEPESATEAAIFACATHVFLQTPQSASCLDALRRLFDGAMFQHLLVFLTFVRTAHFWTRLHPELELEDDIAGLLAVHETLAQCALTETGEADSEAPQTLLNELAALRRERQLWQAAKFSEERFRSLVTVTAQTVWTTDAQGMAVEDSPTWRAFTGQSLDEWTGQGWLNVLHPDDRDRAAAAWRKCVRDRTPLTIEYRLRRHDGEYCWMLARAVPVIEPDGSVREWVGANDDINEQRTMQSALRASEARFRAVVESNMVGIGFWRSDGTITDANDTLLRMIGYRRDELAAGGVRYPDITPAEYFAVDERAMAETRAAGFCTPYEKEYQRRDGSRIAVLIGGARFADDPEQGPFFALDISEQKRAEARERRLVSEAAQANARFKAFFEQGALFAGIMSVDGRLLETNRLALEACGYTREQVIGRLFWECPWWSPSPDLMRRIQEATRQAAAGKAFRAELPYFVADGSERMVDIIMLPVTDDAGHVLFLAPTGTDITDRTRAEQSLRQSEAKHRALTEALPFGVWQTDPRGHTEYANSYCLDYVGGTLQRIQEQGWSPIVHPDDAPALQRKWERARRTGEPIELEHRMRRAADGQYRWFHVIGVPVLDEHGRIVKWIGAGIDIDDLRRAEQALREIDRRKDDFLATLAHELRNPLAPVRTAVQILRQAPELKTLEVVLPMMERQLGQMVHLIDDLLDVARITRGTLQLRKQPVELEPVLQDAVEACRPLMDSCGHKLEVRLAPEKIVLDGDPTRLTQIFSNLLDNAAKYSERGARIELSAQRQGNEAVVRVSDTGRGIAEQMLPRIFELFTQAPKGEDQPAAGLGIGLSVVKRLVEMHGGEIRARSDGVGKGSEFTVRLPVLAPPPMAAHVPQPARNEPAGDARARVLVVDDVADSTQSLAMLLRMMGHEVCTAQDGLEAVEAARAFHPDLVLLDIGLPKLSGHEACRRIRALPAGESMTIVALTGWGQEEDRRKSSDAGFDYHLLKPVDPAALAKLLHDLPAGRARRDRPPVPGDSGRAE